MASPSIQRIERLNYGISAVLIVLCLVTQSREVTLGLAVGAGLTCLNFYILRRLIVKWTTEAALGRAGNSAMLMLPKMIGLMGAVAAAVLLLPIDIIAFVVGYSIFIASIVIETTYSAFRPSPDEPFGNGNGSPSDENSHG